MATWRSKMVARTYYATKKEGARISCENLKLVYLLGRYWEVSQEQTKTILELTDKTGEWSVRLSRTSFKMAQEREKQADKR